VDITKSWGLLPEARQVPGQWTCTAHVEGEGGVSTRFELVD
jgi:hypothetical protein